MVNDYFRYDENPRITLVKWKIKQGCAINQIPLVIFTYREIGADDRPQETEKKYKINKSGIIVKRLRKNNGDKVETGDVLFEYEMCSHPTLMKDLCAVCGVNINNFDTAEQRKITENTSVSMVHSIPELRVSKKDAEDLGRADEDRLLKSRKLVLLVDLDQTIVHSTNQEVPNDVAEILHYQLYGSQSPWYHTKFRPFMKEFLDEISKYYELHICTFGARRYAHQIAHLIDPNGKYFPKDRILSRDEFFDPRSKTGNMKSLFPCGDSMVCIIDDRVDVWNYSPNVVHVKPYLYFKTDDINAPEKLNIGFNMNNPNGAASLQQDGNKDVSTKNLLEEESKLDSETESAKDQKKEVTKEEEEDKDDDCDKQVPVENESQEEDNGDKANSSGEENLYQNKNTLDEYVNTSDDTDDYLLYLKDILIKIHSKYYEEYDEKLRYKCEEEEILIPDLKRIIPTVRRLVLHGVKIVFSGVIATHVAPSKNRFYRLAQSLGAIITNDVIVNGSPKTTHLVATKWGTNKVNKCIKYSHIKMVTPDWLLTCAERWERVDEALFELNTSTHYNVREKEELVRAPRDFFSNNHNEDNLTPSTSSEKTDVDQKTMLDLLPLSSFSSNDLSDMGKEVDDACSDGSSSDEDNPDSSESEDAVQSRLDEDEESMNYALEGEFPSGWKDNSEKRGRKRLRREDEDDESGSSSSQGRSTTSSSDAESIGSVDEEMAAALEREFFKPSAD